MCVQVVAQNQEEALTDILDLPSGQLPGDG